jgi:thiol-disulfide isomerase/thioredoxin
MNSFGSFWISRQTGITNDKRNGHRHRLIFLLSARLSRQSQAVNLAQIGIMKKRCFILGVMAMIHACAAEELPTTATALRDDGAFGFPQKEATVICDRPTLRFSVWNNDQYLFAQAIMWTDDDAAVGKDQYDRVTFDWSCLMLNVDPNGKVTPNVDREYVLNPGPPGLYYVTELGIYSQTGMYDDSKGRGAIRYLTVDGKLVRVDTYLVPLVEISRHAGETLRMAYWGFSPKPLLTVNSTSYVSEKKYNRWAMPLSEYHEYTLTNGGEIDVAAVPEGREDIPTNSAMPKIETAAPEISAKEWINSKTPLTLAGLRGKVVVVDFWATWCTSCTEGIPRLNELQRKYAGKNFQLLGLVREGHQTMDPFLAKRRVDYPIGLESRSLDEYAITEIPLALVIDPEGKIIWIGDPASPEMDKAVARALGF